MSDFVHLHLHSEGSFLDGMGRVEEIVDKAKELGHSAVAISDHGEVNRHLALQKACGQELKPIFAFEAYHAENRKERVRDQNHLLLIAKNKKGLSNLWALSSLAYIEGFYYKPRLDFELLEKYSEGIIASSACLAGKLPSAILSGDSLLALRYLEVFRKIFREDFYLEIHTNTLPEQAKVNVELVKMAEERGIPLIAACDAHYINKEDFERHELFLAIQTATNIYDENRLSFGTPDYYMLSSEEVLEALDYLPRSIVEESMRNTKMIADSCDVYIENETRFPRFQIPHGKTQKEYLIDLLEEGFKRKVVAKGKDKATYFKRLEEEVSLICQKNFEGYFLIVADYTRWAKERMLVGPGRGSSGGSLVAFLLDITEIDPIETGLLFGRFLTLGRKSMPDIDLDFPTSKRWMLKDYLVQKYGDDCVASIGTMSRFRAKGIIRDVGRGLGLSYDTIEKISWAVDRLIGGSDLTEFDKELGGRELSWEDICRKVEILPLIKRYPKLFEMCGGFMRLIRQSSTNAAGMVISDSPLFNILPLRIKKEVVITQFDKNEVEELGFLKVDILGVRNLGTLEVALDLIKKRYGIDIDLYNLSKEAFEEKRVWSDIWAGNCLGLFQIETYGLQDLAKQLKPNSIDDLSVMIAVFRPGITRAGAVQKYIKRKCGEEKVTYLHSKLKPILEKTYGVMVYQEQIMKICIELASYDLEEADEVRKILSKRLYDAMKKERVTFVSRAVNNGILGDTANKIFDQMETFGIYGFNEAHSYAYALLTFWTAYIKTLYPAEYLTALFVTNPDEADLYVQECRRLGTKLLPPDVNESGGEFTLVGDSIRFGLSNIMQVGPVAVKSIIEKQPYTSFEDFLSKINKRSVKKQVVVNLIKVGAFDSIDPDRYGLMNKYFTWRKEQYSIDFSYHTDDQLERLENELLGICISVDKLSGYLELFKEICTDSTLESLPLGSQVIIGGVLESVRRKTSRNNNPLVFLSIQLYNKKYDIIVFGNKLAAFSGLLSSAEGKAVVIYARISERDQYRKSLIFENLKLASIVKEEEDLKKKERIIRLQGNMVTSTM